LVDEVIALGGDDAWRGKPLVRRKTWREVKALREVKTLGGEGWDGGEDLGLQLKTLAGAEDTR
jgi:hypothetical protein